MKEVSKEKTARNVGRRILKVFGMGKRNRFEEEGLLKRLRERR